MDQQNIKGAVNAEIEVEDFTDLMDKTKESTASSPSNIHIGHYKACTLYAILEKQFV